MLKLKRQKAESGSPELRRALGGMQPPTIPGMVAAAIEQVSSPDCDLREVAETVGRDPGLSARLLSIVNSAAYAPRNPIVGVTQAVTMFGKNQLESMLISLAASRVVASKPARGFDLTEFWHTSAWRASAAAALSNHFDRSRRSENFSASLLEGIAIPLLASSQPRYSGVLADWKAGKGELKDLEKEVLGWTHTTVAGWLFDEWGFPAALREAVTDEGIPEQGTAKYPVVRVVSTLSGAVEPDAAIAATAARVTAVFDMPDDLASALLETTRTEAMVLAQS
ncbi:MAG: HDOD domain-containing protein, partial [bacterium]|nr:HDOD domain-containing protein [bacterium]